MRATQEQTPAKAFEHHLDQEVGIEAISFADRGLQVEEIAELLARSEPVVRKALEGQQRPFWIPVPDEIEKRAAEVRGRWTDNERSMRRCALISSEYEPASRRADHAVGNGQASQECDAPRPTANTSTQGHE